MATDIVLPDVTMGDPEPHEKAPVAGIVNADGILLQVVNWYDYMGFEVRRLCGSGDPTDHGPRLLFIGYVTPGGMRAYNTDLVERHFASVRDALNWLLGRTE